MKKLTVLACTAVATFAFAVAPASAQNMGNQGTMTKTSGMKMKKNPKVGGAAMYSNKNIVENAMMSPIHTTLVKAVVAADLAETLKGAGPFTVFAPTDKAFGKVPSSAVNSLMQPENKQQLAGVLTYHVVAGSLDSAALMQQIKAGGGKASLTTVNGATLTAMMEGKNIVLMDAKGGKSKVTTKDVYQSNGVIHVIDSVVMP